MIFRSHINTDHKFSSYLEHEEEHFSIGDLHVFTDIDEEEDLAIISLFSNDDEQVSIDDLYMFTGEEAEPPDANEDTIWI